MVAVEKRVSLSVLTVSQLVDTMAARSLTCGKINRTPGGVKCGHRIWLLLCMFSSTILEIFAFVTIGPSLNVLSFMPMRFLSIPAWGSYSRLVQSPSPDAVVPALFSHSAWCRRSRLVQPFPSFSAYCSLPDGRIVCPAINWFNYHPFISSISMLNSIRLHQNGTEKEQEHARG